MDSQAIDARAIRIRALVLDVDGVLTDGRVLLLPGGEEGRTFNVRDGLGIQLMGAGRRPIPVAFLSGRDSEAVRRRATELGVKEVHLGIPDKVAAYEQLLTTFGVKDENVAYVGDDLPDLPLLERCGLSFAVADAVSEVRSAAHVVLRAGGGQGAVREACERILKAQGAWIS
ncbi:MAG: HAD hydrolase family protein [Myxococcales bacterium]|nr:HAD hydrolase family protein [Myxococcales bacterium]